MNIECTNTLTESLMTHVRVCAHLFVHDGVQGCDDECKTTQTQTKHMMYIMHNCTYNIYITMKDSISSRWRCESHPMLYVSNGQTKGVYIFFVTLQIFQR